LSLTLSDFEKMIRLFRKIRHRLLSEKSYSMYMLYAAGEIFLVMVGILLALQIDNWNEVRKERELEQIYYCKILEDINQDVRQIEKHILENEERIKNNNLLLNLLQQEYPDQATLVNTLRRSITKTGSVFKSSKTGFDDLKSSGNLYIIQDQEIKDLLIEYYSILQNYVDVISVNSAYTVEIYYNSSKNFADLGWQHLDYVKAEIDTTLVNISLLNKIPYPDPILRKQLISDAMVFMTTNARKKALFNDLANEIYLMQNTMKSKCKQK